jgi:hypothetical protein
MELVFPAAAATSIPRCSSPTRRRRHIQESRRGGGGGGWGGGVLWCECWAAGWSRLGAVVDAHVGTHLFVTTAPRPI